MAEKYISQVTIPDGSVYKIKDTSAWGKIGDLYSIINQGALELVVLQSGQNLPTADASTMGKIYLKPDTTHNPSTNDVFDEYVTVDKGASANPRYVWEKIGNTDVNLSNYATLSHTHDASFTVPKHTYTPSGTVSQPTFSGTSMTSSGTFTPAGTVTMNASVNSATTVTTASGSVTYTPAGSVSQPTFSGSESQVTVSGSVTGNVNGTTGSGSSHNHSMGSTKGYLHTTSVVKADGFDSSAFLKNVSTLKLSTTAIYCVSSNTTTASKMDTSTAVTVATKGTDVSVPRITANESGTVTVTCTSSNLSNGTLGNETNTQAANTPMWNAKVDANETLYFTFKPINSSTKALTGVSSATTTATATAFTPFNVTPAGSTTQTIFKHTFTDVTVPIKLSGTTTVATGGTASNGSGSTVAVANGSTGTAYTGITSNGSIGAFTSLNTTASGGTTVITAVDANTGSESAHTHNVSIAVSSGSFSTTATFTPSGTVSQPTFSGTGVRLVTGNIYVPSTFTFSGTQGNISVTGTPAGSVSQPTFSGTQADITHENVAITTSGAHQ